MRRFVELFVAVQLLGCAGAKPAPTQSTAVKEPDQTAEAQETPASEAAFQKQLEIVENPEVQVMVKAELGAKYEQMKLDPAIAQLLVSAQLDLNVPAQFTLVEGGENPIWNGDLRLSSKAKRVDVIIKVIPSDQFDETAMTADGKSPSKVIANELMALLMKLNGANLVADMQQHPKSEAQTRFNADTYATATFAPVPEFSSFPIGSAGIMYKKGLGKVVVISLLSDISDPDTRTEWVTGANAIRFKEDKIP